LANVDTSFEIASLLNCAKDLQQDPYRISHSTLNMSLHHLVKCKISKAAKL